MASIRAAGGVTSVPTNAAAGSISGAAAAPSAARAAKAAAASPANAPRTANARIPSIRRRLLVFLLPPLIALLSIGVFVDYRAALIFARKTYDQRLTDAALMVAAKLDLSAGGLPKQLPIWRLPTSGIERDVDFSYSIVGPNGQLLAGDTQVPSAPQSNKSNPSFANAALDGKEVRVVSYRLPGSSGTVTVNVAGADDAHTGAARFVLGSTWLMGFIQLDITLLLVWIGVHFGLKPLSNIKQDIETRSARELRPLDLTNVPAEIRPLVDGLNLLFQMLAEAAQAQRQFVADTAHQLRTPITGLLGHLEVLMREPAAAAVRDRLESLHDGMTRLSHSANQLLTLARAEPSATLAARFESVDVKVLVERVIERNVDRSLESGHDLGAEVQSLHVTGSERLLEDLLGNLVDNALNYTPSGCRITVRTGSDESGKAYLEVEDDGPGIPASERTRVRERFYRLPGSTGHGCGLGLAIVDEITRVHAANLTIDAGAGGRGTRIRISFAPQPSLVPTHAVPVPTRSRVTSVTTPPPTAAIGLRTASQSGEI